MRKAVKACPYLHALVTYFLLLDSPVVGFQYEQAQSLSKCRDQSPIQRKRTGQCLSLLPSHSSNDGIITENLDDQRETEGLVESHPFDDPEPVVVTPELPPMPSVKLLRFRGKESRPNLYNIPEDPQKEWEWFYAQLVAYQRGEPDTDTIKEALLRNWMANQRKCFMKTLGVLDIGEQGNWGTEYLSLERKLRLDEVGFYWGHLQPESLTNDVIYSEQFQRRVRLKHKDWMWNPIYNKLKQYYIDNKTTNVPLASEDGLGVWTAKQRSVRFEIPERRRLRLDELNFNWDWKDKNAILPEQSKKVGPIPAKKEKRVPFSKRVKQLKDYRTTHGDCNVPIDDEGGLGKWVSRIKSRRNEFTDRTVMQLEKLGFEFDGE